MFRIAIVEDVANDAESLKSHLNRYFSEKNKDWEVTCFSEAMTFLDEYHSIYDLIFMDIQMPYINGLDAVKHLRTKDPNVNIIFTTNLTQYALQGFELFALGFLVKPITYVSLFTLLDKVFYSLDKKEEKILIHSKDGIFAIPLEELKYVEIFGHKVKYVSDDKIIECSGSLKTIEEALPDDLFVRCDNSYIVNLKQITSVNGNDIQVGKYRIPISRARKKEFMAKLLSFYGKQA